MPKYTVTADQLAHGHWIDGDEVDGKTPRVWAHTDYKRGSTIELPEKDAERHLASGTVAKPKDAPVDPDGPKATDDLGNDTSAPPAKK